MKKLNFKIEEKECILYMKENENTEYVLIQPVDEHDIDVLDNEVKYISENISKNFSLAAFKIDDWNSELTPWEMPLLRGKGNFGNEAGKTLEFIKEKLIPSLAEFINIQEKNVKYILGGYSLAGLFSLWSGYKVNIFAGTAGVSPSVWYKNWMDFVKDSKPLVNNIYLSLGNLEEKTKHQILSKIGDNIREYIERFYENGNIKEKGEIYEFDKQFQNSDSEFKKMGKFECFYENGNIKERGVYDWYGKKDGLFEYFSKNGKLIKKENYKDGELI